MTKFKLIALLVSAVAISAGQTTETFSTPGTFTWTAPVGVNSASVEIWGGGGGGGVGYADGSSAYGGGGGGGGGYQGQTVNVVGGTNYTIVVGVGGYPGSAGGSSSAFGYTASGGTSNWIYAGSGGSPQGGYGTTGQTSQIATYNYCGYFWIDNDYQYGCYDFTVGPANGGTGGSSPNGGQGAYGGTVDQFIYDCESAASGSAPGGGGGGGATFWINPPVVCNNMFQGPGAGGPGRVKITYVGNQPPTQVTLSSPGNGTTGVQLNPTLSWVSSPSATSYDVRFGTTN
jgi:hypothetical protein